MSLPQYGALVGTVINKLDSPSAKQKNPHGKPHYQILVDAADVKYRIAVNVKSDQQPANLQFYLAENYSHPILQQVKLLQPGFTLLDKKPGTAALDFIRGNLFKISDMKIVPAEQSGSDNDLNDIFNLYVEQALSTPGALVYAFGSRWGPEENKQDEYFDFEPGNGIHDIHMNQGNTGNHAGDNGVYQDGGIFIYYPDEVRYVAMFLKFQSQVVHTDDGGADPIPGPGNGDDTIETVTIFAAMVNPKGGNGGKEAVYLLNITDSEIDLDGWMIADKLKNKELISHLSLKAGDTARILLSGNSAQLSNKGGIITLLNKEGIKISGVAYTGAEAEKEGYVVKF